MTIPKTIRLSKTQVDQIVDKLAVKLMSMIRAQIVYNRPEPDPEPDPVPCVRCQCPIDPRGCSECDACLEISAAERKLLNSYQHCDICDSYTKIREAGEITVTCSNCFYDPKHSIETSILDRVD